jgi:hypothetical protein
MLPGGSAFITDDLTFLHEVSIQKQWRFWITKYDVSLLKCVESSTSSLPFKYQSMAICLFPPSVRWRWAPWSASASAWCRDSRPKKVDIFGIKNSCSPRSPLCNIWRAILRGAPFEASAVMVWSSLCRWKVVSSCVRVMLAFTKWARQKFSCRNLFWYIFSKILLCLVFLQNYTHGWHFVFDSFGLIFTSDFAWCAVWGSRSDGLKEFASLKSGAIVCLSYASVCKVCRTKIVFFEWF